MSDKVACVIQGNIRTGTDEVVREIMRHFDVVILSTWSDEKEMTPEGDFHVVLSDKPENTGFSHRNYQRKGTSAGIELAEQLGCTYLLKWRTDMLPTRLNVKELLSWANYRVPDGLPSRLATCAFRNLSVEPDWFSSIPDLFAFGHIEVMKLLWGSQGIDFSKAMNPPERMLRECGTEWMQDASCGGIFCAESELYANFRDRLQTRLSSELTHTVIASEYMYLFDHERLGICWFAANGGFRPVEAAVYFPWWTERTWRSGKPRIIGKGYPVTAMQKIAGGWLDKFSGKLSKIRQANRYRNYCKENSEQALLMDKTGDSAG